MVRGGVWRRRLSTAGFYGLAALFMLPTVFVFYWMITLSLKPQVEATAYPPSFVRFSVTLAGYREVFTKYPFFLYTWNSLVVATGCTALGLAVGLPAAYSIARWRQQRLAVVILVARIIPGIAYLIPWYIFFRNLRMVDTYGALILSHLIVGLPIIIWVMISFFEDVPADLEDAGLIDGCSHLGVFWRIALPLVKPGVVATGHPVLRVLVEQLPLLGDPGRPDDAHPAHRRVQHDLLRGDQLGHPGRRRHPHHPARAPRRPPRPAAHRHRPHLRRREAVVAAEHQRPCQGDRMRAHGGLPMPRTTGPTRSRPLVLPLIAAVLALTAAVPAAAQPAGQAVIAFHVTIAPTWFDPSTAPPQITPFGVLYAIHDALVRPYPGHKMGPSLAESWKESPDGKTYEFKLRRGLKFHNGDAVTAEDVKFSFERYKGAGRQGVPGARPGGRGRRSPDRALPPEGAVAGLHDVLRHHRHRGRHRRAEEVRHAGR